MMTLILLKRLESVDVSGWVTPVGVGSDANRDLTRCLFELIVAAAILIPSTCHSAPDMSCDDDVARLLLNPFPLVEGTGPSCLRMIACKLNRLQQFDGVAALEIAV